MSNREEAEETFRKFDSNQNGVLEIVELQTRIVFDRNRDGAVTEDEARYFLDEHDQVDFETFVTLCWPKVKPFLMLDSGLFKPPSDVDELEKEERDPGQYETEEAELQHENDGYDLDGSEPSQPYNEEEEGAEHDEEEEDDEGLDEHEAGEGQVEAAEEPKQEYDPETQELIRKANEARNQHNEADRHVREIDQEMRNIEDLLNKDFGKDEEFAPLNGECINYEDREYIYKLCLFDKAIQQPKNGGAETRYSRDTSPAPQSNFNESFLLTDWVPGKSGPPRTTPSCGTATGPPAGTDRLGRPLFTWSAAWTPGLPPSPSRTAASTSTVFKLRPPVPSTIRTGTSSSTTSCKDGEEATDTSNRTFLECRHRLNHSAFFHMSSRQTDQLVN